MTPFEAPHSVSGGRLRKRTPNCLLRLALWPSCDGQGDRDDQDGRACERTDGEVLV